MQIKKAIWLGVVCTLILVLSMVGCAKPAPEEEVTPPPEEEVTPPPTTPEVKFPNNITLMNRQSTDDMAAMMIATNAVWEREINIPCLFITEPATEQRIAKTEEGIADISWSTYRDFHHAYFGTGGFEKAYNVRLVSSQAPSYLGYWTIPRAGIKTVEDFAGKKVAYSSARSLVMTEIGSSIVEYYGVSDKIVDIPDIPRETRFTGLSERVVDAVLSFATHMDEIQQYSPDAFYISVSKECGDYAHNKYPFFSWSIIPEGYRGLNFPAGIGSIDVGSGLFCRADFPADVLYELLKIKYDHFDELLRIHPAFAEGTLDLAVDPKAPIPYHEGAVRFFKEKGIWTAEAEANQQKLLAGR